MRIAHTNRTYTVVPKSDLNGDDNQNELFDIKNAYKEYKDLHNTLEWCSKSKDRDYFLRVLANIEYLHRQLVQLLDAEKALIQIRGNCFNYDMSFSHTNNSQSKSSLRANATPFCATLPSHLSYLRHDCLSYYPTSHPGKTRIQQPTNSDSTFFATSSLIICRRTTRLRRHSLSIAQVNQPQVVRHPHQPNNIFAHDTQGDLCVRVVHDPIDVQHFDTRSVDLLPVIQQEHRWCLPA